MYAGWNKGLLKMFAFANYESVIRPAFIGNTLYRLGMIFEQHDRECECIDDERSYSYWMDQPD